MVVHLLVPAGFAIKAVVGHLAIAHGTATLGTAAVAHGAMHGAGLAAVHGAGALAGAHGAATAGAAGAAHGLLAGTPAAIGHLAPLGATVAGQSVPLSHLVAGHLGYALLSHGGRSSYLLLHQTNPQLANLLAAGMAHGAHLSGQALGTHGMTLAQVAATQPHELLKGLELFLGMGNTVVGPRTRAWVMDQISIDGRTLAEWKETAQQAVTEDLRPPARLTFPTWPRFSRNWLDDLRPNVRRPYARLLDDDTPGYTLFENETIDWDRSAGRMLDESRSSGPPTALTFHVHRRVSFGETVGVVGSLPSLGHWEPTRTRWLSWTPGNTWTGSVMIAASEPGTFEYKFLTRRTDGTIIWDGGVNRSARKSAGLITAS
jgi:hypothetical protein